MATESIGNFEDWWESQEELNRREERRARNNKSVDRIAAVANVSREMVIRWVRLRLAHNSNRSISTESYLERLAGEVERDGSPFSSYPISKNR